MGGEDHKLAKQPFEHALHSLYGLPYCWSCREKQFSRQVLEQHVSCSMCPVVKDGIGRGLNFSKMLDKMLQCEQENPPIPSEGASQAFDRLSMFDDSLTGPLSNILANTSKIRQLLNCCAICSQRTQQASRLDLSLRTTGPSCASRLVRLPFVSGMQCCNKRGNPVLLNRGPVE